MNRLNHDPSHHFLESTMMLNYLHAYQTLAIGMTFLAIYIKYITLNNTIIIEFMGTQSFLTDLTSKRFDLNKHLANSFPTISNFNRWCRVILYHKHIAFTRPTKSGDLYMGWKIPKIFDDGNSASAASNRVKSSSISRKANVCCS